MDSKTKGPLIGANVILKGTAQGSATNIDGEFFISGLSPGVVDIQAAYIGYKSKTLTNINIPLSSSDKLIIELEADVISVSEVNVQAERKAGSQAEAMNVRQNALEMQDNISSDQISKSGDTHVADAVRLSLIHI